MVSRLAQLVYLMAPAYVANMAPPFVRFWHGWNRPISERWLGSHKTAVGALAGVGAALIVSFNQARLHWRGSLVDYAHWLAIGVLLGAGAMGGDLLKSLLKRRCGIAPGARWIPADQLDFAVGALILIQPRAHLSWADIALILAVTFIADITVNQVAFRLGVRDTAW
jgi:CDP-2,3-bis-(O-geranylgeranyl)-sn-glycerol synthase